VCLSRASRVLRTILLSSAAEKLLWKPALDPETIPPCPEDMSKPQWLEFIYKLSCHVRACFSDAFLPTDAFYSNALNIGITPSYGLPDSAFANDAPGKSELFGYRAPLFLVQSSNVHAPCHTRFMARPPDLGKRNFVPRAFPKFLPQGRPRLC